MPAAYVAELSHAGNAVADSPERLNRQVVRAAHLVNDVLIDLGFEGAHTAGQDPWEVVHDLQSGATSPQDQSDATDILFTVTLGHLFDALTEDPVLIASTLRKRLGADMRAVSEALLRSNLLEVATAEILNRAKADSILTGQQVQVLEQLWKGVAISEIASHLSISQKTVNRHLEDIRTRIGARSRSAIIQRAREQRLFVLVPALAACERVHLNVAPLRSSSKRVTP